MKRPIIVTLLAAAIAGPAVADFDQGLMAYRAGDYDRAFSEFRADAVSGHATAQFNLGVMYYRGEGVDKDLIRAYAWIELSTQHRGEAELREAQDVLSVMLTPAEIDEAMDTARRLAATHGLEYRGPLDDGRSRVAVR